MAKADFLSMRVEAKIAYARSGFTDRDKWKGYVGQMMDRCMRVIIDPEAGKERGQRAIFVMGKWMEGMLGEEDQYYWDVALPAIRKINPGM